MNPYILINRQGIPRLEGNAVVNGNDVSVTFKPHAFLNYPYAGLILFKINSYTAPSTAGTITFTSSANSSISPKDSTGVAIQSTDASLAAGGLFLGYFENGSLNLFNI